ncbi:MAG: ABC transporter ATP-binding protein [Desulfobacterales bacterium]|jgi:branched-chain amino acid transport system ATP-binding protein|nr:ABC transporter ATP-binding protein [Desulfobacterales bacterium]MDP6808640.1 ABC transporter ATP-binding protein [Desulfobacterales bacterium]|tara:strand:+ start:25745 stop:26653 length:909 start_codon:yes stop_codon:yes gene_type:complete
MRRGSTVLELTSVTKYFGGLAAVDDLDLEINKGEIVGLIGPNGAGKTTLFNLITGVLRVTEGNIRFEDKNITNKKPCLIAEHGIVRTFQETSVFPDFSVMLNIIAACHLNPRIGFLESIFRTSKYHEKEEHIVERAMEIMQFAGLWEVKDVPAKSLPHGYKKILGIAIALAARPKLLLLDEPLCGMNAAEVVRTNTLIRKAWESSITLLLIEHNMKATMSLCQRIVVLSFGMKIAEGPPQQIKKDRKVIQAYLGAARKYEGPFRYSEELKKSKEDIPAKSEDNENAATNEKHKGPFRYSRGY